MEPPKSDVGVLSAIVGVLSFLGGMLAGVVRVSWSLSKSLSKFNRMKQSLIFVLNWCGNIWAKRLEEIVAFLTSLWMLW